MWQAIGHVLPIAVAVALSTVPIMATVILLLSPHRDRTAGPFLAGWVIGLVVVVTAFTLLAQTVPKPRHPQLALAVGEIAIGLAIIILAAVSWRRSGQTEVHAPRWLRAVGSLGPWSSFGFALALNVRPKAVLLAAATGLIIRADGLRVGEGAIVIGVYTVIAASTVAVPILATAMAPDRTRDWLLSTRTWLDANSRVVAVVIMLMVGVFLIGNALTRL
jgi:hypothetical protein